MLLKKRNQPFELLALGSEFCKLFDEHPAFRSVDKFDIDNTGCFVKPRVGWLGCDSAPAALQELQMRLGRYLRACGFEPEKRPYHPHVTVVRKTHSVSGAAGFEPIRWRVDSFSLIEVVQGGNGVHYHAVETYPLA